MPHSRAAAVADEVADHQLSADEIQEKYGELIHVAKDAF